MTLPGWYPDPSGQPDRYRYWTGTGWSAQTTGDPGAASPLAAAIPNVAPARPSKPRRTGLLIGLLALLLVVVLVAGVFVFRALSGRNGTAAESDPTSTVSGYDDSSPFPSATPSASPTPKAPAPKTPSPRPTRPAHPAPMTACPIGGAEVRQPHPNDGRIHGGGLSFAPQSSWADGSGYLNGLSWAYDVGGQDQRVEPGWLAVLAVGSLHTADGFQSTRQSAEGVMQCISTSGYYRDVSGRKDVTALATTVDGKPAWELRSEIRVDDPDVSVPGDVVEVIVVDAGAGDALAMFVGAVPIGDNARIALLDATIKDLRVG